jgi:hypothetical protein
MMIDFIETAMPTVSASRGMLIIRSVGSSCMLVHGVSLEIRFRGPFIVVL